MDHLKPADVSRHLLSCAAMLIFKAPMIVALMEIVWEDLHLRVDSPLQKC